MTWQKKRPEFLLCTVSLFVVPSTEEGKLQEVGVCCRVLFSFIHMNCQIREKTFLTNSICWKFSFASFFKEISATSTDPSANAKKS
jgi:hypothetical protein